MSGETSYKIYDASAGSGKTYTLVKAYLERILRSGNQRAFRNTLAITFTNKAVNELKGRILQRLADFTQDPIPEEAIPLFRELQEELGIDAPVLRERAVAALKEILHNYAFFDLSTIDKFTHRLIRTFARDLNLSYNFDVILDTDLLIEEGVARVISKAGVDDKLSDYMVGFAQEKTDEEKSWDISYDLEKVGKIIFKEQHFPHLDALKEKSLEDFEALRKQLVSDIARLKAKTSGQASMVLEKIHDAGANLFKKVLPNHFEQIIDHSYVLSRLYSNKLEQNLEDGSYLLKNSKIPYEGFSEELLESYRELRAELHRIAFYQNIYANLIPLALVSAILNEVNAILTERNQLPLARFNAIISREIKDQPTPFIYERLGEVYRHYAIDEFQDTSTLQWDNLIPLIQNALDGEGPGAERGSLTLVGDAKQAIYRWRGGRAEQFLGLSSGKINPFNTKPQVVPLDRNFRSFDEIIAFNNEFFSITSQYISGPEYKSLFDGNHHQHYNSRKGGLVSIKIIDPDEGANKNEVYNAKVLNTVTELVDNGFPHSDICVLVRQNKEGQEIATELAKNDIPVISSDSLLLKNNPAVKFLVDLLKFRVSPQDPELRFNVLYFLARDKDQKHEFYSAHLNALPQLLNDHYNFDIEQLNQTTVYDGLELAIRQFDLNKTPSAYLMHFMEEVLQIAKKEDGTISTFLAYWENKKDNLSINASEDLNAVRVMTIHKAKGLEFPIVIYPYANASLRSSKERIWVPLNKEEFKGFDRMMVSVKKEMEYYPTPHPEYYAEEIQKLELDSFNVLYVALTRAVKALFIITEDGKTKYGVKSDYSGLFYHYLQMKKLWSPEKKEYRLGTLPSPNTTNASTQQENSLPYHYTQKDRPAFKPITQSGVLWDTFRGEAIKYGDLVHHILGQIETADDLPDVLCKYEATGDFNKDERKIISETVQRIIDHPSLREFFNKDKEVKNEVAIIAKNGVILRPDRLVIEGNDCTVIEYKTGLPDSEHENQVNTYAEAIKEMGFRVSNKILVYIGQEIQIKDIK